MEIADQPPEQRQAKQRRVEAIAKAFHLQRAPEDHARERDQQQQQPPIAGQEGGEAHHHAREQRQFLPHRVELLHHLGHDEDHERGDHADGKGGQDRGIGDSGQHFGADHRLALHQVRQALHDGRQAARAFACRNHRAIEWREAAGLRAQRIGQPPPLQHAAMHRAHDRADMLLLALATDGAQRLLQRADLDQRGELAREECQFLGAQPRRAQRQARAPARLGGRARLQPHDEQLARIQPGARIVDRVGLDLARPLAACRVDRHIVVISHRRWFPPRSRRAGIRGSLLPPWSGRRAPTRGPPTPDWAR